MVKYLRGWALHRCWSAHLWQGRLQSLRLAAVVHRRPRRALL